MFGVLASFLVAFRLLALVAAQSNATLSTFNPLRPPAIPLAVRNPYMNTWLFAGSDGGNGGYLAGQWPQFWTGQITAWTGLITVDGLVYTWMGAPSGAGGDGTPGPALANQTDFTYTSTQSVFTLDIAEKITMIITFLSPVDPTNEERSSLPVTYMNVDVKSKDGKDHKVNLYTDTSAEWCSGDQSAIAQWDYEVLGGTARPMHTAKGSTKSTSKHTSIKSTKTSKHSTKKSTTAMPTSTTTKTASTAHLEQRFEEEDVAHMYEKRQRQTHSYKTYGTKTRYTQTTSVPHTRTDKPITTAPAHYLNFKTVSVTASSARPQNTVAGGVAVHKFWRQQQLQLSEESDMADWGYWHYATANMGNLTHQSGTDYLVRGQFINSSYLLNKEDTNYRPINDNYPVFGFAMDLGYVGPTPVSTVFSLTLTQKNVIQFEGANGNQTLPGTWLNYFANDKSAVPYFYNDYSNALAASNQLDDKVAFDSAAAGGDNYTSITSLAVRQAFGALQYANYNGQSLLFMKEISSDGNVNTVDVIFPLHPILLYLNPTMLKQLLDPLFINQESGHWPYAYSIHDIGAHYPNATGHDDGLAEMQPLEECGDMIIMTLGYAQRAGDNAYLAQHYDILRQWNNYLVNDSLIPANQISTDDFAGSLANQTNLAVKGIIGIGAMAKIANLTDNLMDGQNFTNISTTYIKDWQVLGIAQDATPPHTTLAYGMNDTHGLLYNIWADKALNLGLVPDSVFDMQSNFYPTVELEYGVPLDTRHNYTKVDWELFCAAVAGDSTKEMFINDIANFINTTPTNQPFTDLYDCLDAQYALYGTPQEVLFTDRPVVGGVFALLALNGASS